MKTCSKCRKTLPRQEFHKNKGYADGHMGQCRDCYNAWRRDRYADYGNVIDQLKDVPCADCKQHYPAVCMDFDHVTGTKEFDIGAARQRGKSLDAILTEIEKCEVVCANCHRLRTRERQYECNS